MAITIRPYSDGDLAGVTRLLNTARPDLPPLTPEMYRHYRALDEQEPRHQGERFVATQAGNVIGYVAISLLWDLARPNLYQTRLCVDPTLRGTGIGRRLFDLLVQRARDLGAERIDGEVREDDPASMAFLERRGCVASGHREQYARLETRGANLDRFRIVAERLTREGIRICTLADFGTDLRSLRAVYDAEHEPFLDMPNSDAIQTRMSFEAWIDAVIQSPGKSPETFWVAVDGDRPVGITSLQLYGNDAAYQWFTGVIRAYRGRGIAQALKLHATEWAHDHGITWLYTGNDTQNKRMLAVNAALGYVALAASIEMQLNVTGLVPVNARREVLELEGHANGVI